MTAEQSSEDNDIKSTPQSASPTDAPCSADVRHHEPASGSLAPRTSILAIAGGFASGGGAHPTSVQPRPQLRRPGPAIDGVLRRELSRARQFNRSTSA
jgi:hypothetical protein